MSITNVANAIVIVGVSFVAAWSLMNKVSNGLFYIGLGVVFVMAAWTWLSLDSANNNEMKKNLREKERLQNRKLEMEIRLLDVQIMKEKLDYFGEEEKKKGGKKDAKRQR